MFKTELNNPPDKIYSLHYNFYFRKLYHYPPTKLSIIAHLFLSPITKRVVSNQVFSSISHGHLVLYSLTVASLICILIFSYLDSLLLILTYSSPYPVLWQEYSFFKVNIVIFLPWFKDSIVSQFLH